MDLAIEAVLFVFGAMAAVDVDYYGLLVDEALWTMRTLSPGTFLGGDVGFSMFSLIRINSPPKGTVGVVAEETLVSKEGMGPSTMNFDPLCLKELLAAVIAGETLVLGESDVR